MDSIFCRNAFNEKGDGEYNFSIKIAGHCIPVRVDLPFTGIVPNIHAVNITVGNYIKTFIAEDGLEYSNPVIAYAVKKAMIDYGFLQDATIAKSIAIATATA
jgi:hypothetical protein